MDRSDLQKSIGDRISGPEDLLAVLHEVKLTVCGETVLFGKIVPSCGKHLGICMRSERTAAQAVNSALRS